MYFHSASVTLIFFPRVSTRVNSVAIALVFSRPLRAYLPFFEFLSSHAYSLGVFRAEAREKLFSLEFEPSEMTTCGILLSYWMGC